MQVNPRFINLESIRKDFKGGDDVKISAPMLKDHNVTEVKPVDFNELSNKLFEIAKLFPHKRLAVTYKISEDSSINIEIHPVTSAA